jgi:hypothetical protein
VTGSTARSRVRRLQSRLAPVKAALTRPVDGVLERIEKSVAIPAPPSRSPLRLTCVFLSWDHQRAGGELAALLDVLRSLHATHVTAVVVNNRVDDQPVPQVSGVDLVVPGDNRAWEFSGFDAGVAAVRERAIATDVWLLANDRYRADGRPFLPYLTDATVAAIRELNGLGGHIDAYPTPVESFGYRFRSWITTCFMVATDDVLARCSPLVRVTAAGMEDVLTAGDGLTFRRPGPVGPDHAAYLRAWLTGGTDTALTTRWYGAAGDRALDQTVARRKVQSILNEQLLSAHARSLGIPVVPLKTVARLGRLGLDDEAVRQEVEWIKGAAASGTDRAQGRWSRLRLAAEVGVHRRRSHA